jgi:hypothetical protein
VHEVRSILLLIACGRTWAVSGYVGVVWSPLSNGSIAEIDSKLVHGTT